MQERQIVTHFLVPADEHAPEAIHPTMRALYYPPSCPETGLLLDRLGLFPPCPDVGREAEFGQQLAHFIIVIALVQTHPLGCVWGRLRPLHWDTLDRLPSQLEVIPIRARHGQADGHATAGGEAAALGADLPAICLVLAHLFPPQGGLWSSPRPWPATPSQCPSRPHNPADPAPIGLGRRLPPSTPGSGDGQNCWNRCLCHAGHSIGNQCGGRRK